MLLQIKIYFVVYVALKLINNYFFSEDLINAQARKTNTITGKAAPINGNEIIKIIKIKISKIGFLKNLMLLRSSLPLYREPSFFLKTFGSIATLNLKPQLVQKAD